MNKLIATCTVFILWGMVIWFSLYHPKEYKPQIKRLDIVLQKAGKNRYELEKVLSHYKHDSLKYQAVIFVIENMPEHCSFMATDTVPMLVKSSFEKLHNLALKVYFNNQYIRSFRFVDTLQQIYSPDYYTLRPTLTDSLISVSNRQYANEIIRNKLTSNFEKSVTDIGKELLEKCNVTGKSGLMVEDIHQIKAEYLIDHIDNAFKIWRKSPLARNLSFKEFSETILPYRYFYESLGDIKSSQWASHFFDVFYSSDSLDVNEINRRFNFYTYALDCFEDDGKLLGNYGFYDIFQFYKFDCDRHSEWACKALNSCGIPSILLFRLNRKWNSNHYCIAIRSSEGKYEPFTPKWQSLHDSVYFSKDLKDYQITYSYQPNCPVKLKLKDEEVPDIFNTPFLKDITHQFHKVTDLNITSNVPIKNHKLAYLGVFKPGGWRPIAWGNVADNKQTIHYKNVAVDAYYIAGIFENKRFVPISSPFRLNKEGNIKWVKSEPDNTTMLLTRKYPERKEMTERIQKMAGTKIQVANKKDFSDQITVSTLELTDMDQFIVKAIPVKVFQKFRYIRCVPPKDRLLNLATFEVFTKYHPGDSLVTGSAPYVLSPVTKEYLPNEKLTQIKIYPMEDNPKLKNLLDGNIETYYEGELATFDLGRPMEINQIRFAPRNSNNRIVTGDRYELFYYNSSWESAGIQKATYNYLEYKNIPSGTIYWLHNLDHGKEELPFVYKDGRQIFIN